jgi:hypothetical protein
VNEQGLVCGIAQIDANNPRRLGLNVAASKNGPIGGDTRRLGFVHLWSLYGNSTC